MRIVAIDVGLRRVGLAVSDASATLARPLDVVQLTTSDIGRAAAEVASRLSRVSSEDDDLSELVVGLPRRLDGTSDDMTAWAQGFGEALATRTGLPVTFQDERLTSHEAEALLAERYRDWRDRKSKLDAVSAAIILQDFLDARARPRDERDGPAE